MAEGNALLTVKEAAEVLRISPHTVYSWVSQRTITYQKIGRKVFFKRSVLDAYLEASTVKAREKKGDVY